MNPNGPIGPNRRCGPAPGSPEACAHSNPPASAAATAPAATSVLVLIGFLPGALGAPSLGVDETNVEGTWGLCEDHPRSEEHTSELQSLAYLVCRLLLEKKKKKIIYNESTTYQLHIKR